MKSRLIGIFIMQLFFAQETLSQTSRFGPNDQQVHYGATVAIDPVQQLNSKSDE